MTTPRHRPRSFPTGADLANEGIARSYTSAIRRDLWWGENALRALQDYARIYNEFIAEDAKVWAYERGLQVPPNDGAWGHVIRRAVKDGIITFVGYQHRSGNAARHGTPSRVWHSNLT